jgi:hypothetical protein
MRILEALVFFCKLFGTREGRAALEPEPDDIV